MSWVKGSLEAQILVEFDLGTLVSLGGGVTIPLLGSAQILGQAAAVLVTPTQGELRIGVALLG